MRNQYCIAVKNALTFSFFLLVLITGCKPLMPSERDYNHIPDGKGEHYNTVDNFDSTQVIFWKKGNNRDGFEKFQKNFEKKYNPNHKLACGDCNADAIVYQGEDIPSYYQGQTASSGGSGSGKGGSQVTGDGDTVYWCANFKINFNDSSYNGNENLIRIPQPKQTSSVKTVAIFDTGIDTTGIPQNYFYTNSAASCLGSAANNGWNFVNNTPDWLDDNSGRHGTTVARFVLNEVNAYEANTGIKILPVKTHDKNGEGDLFSVLCAISYVADRKADIVNASFGFYQPKTKGSTPDSSVLFMKEYINYYLTNNNILLIAAAGNVTPQHAERDLDIVSFFPASLSGELENVIAVTTAEINRGSVDANQNYSDNIVNVGVNADTISGNAYLFYNPRIAGSLIRGSSFATPVTTGNLCAHYDMLQPLIGSGNFTRTNILNSMNSAGFIIRTSPNLGQFISGNNAMLKRARP